MRHYDKILVDDVIAAENVDAEEVENDLICKTVIESSKIVGYGSLAAQGWENWDEKIVENLNPSGPGSLKYVIDNALPKTRIKFSVFGIILIDLGAPIVIRTRGLVIDGLSAPESGITISVPNIRVQDNFKLASGANDIIIQGLRFKGPYTGGEFQGSNNQALPAVDGDSKPPATLRRIVFYRCTFCNAMDSAPDCWGRVQDITFQENLWFMNRHPISVSRPPDQGNGVDVCKNDDGTLCHTDGATWYRNAFLKNFERQPKIVAGDHLEYKNNVVYGWAGPNPNEGGGVGLQINPKSGPYPFGSMNIVNNAFIDAYNRPDSGCLFGDIPKGTPENDGSKARAWLGNAGLVSRIWCEGNILPENRQYTKYNCATTPGASNGPFHPSPYARIGSISDSNDLISVIDNAGMPWPNEREKEIKEVAKTAYIAVIK